MPSAMDYGVVEIWLIPVLLILMFKDFLNGKMEHWFRLEIPGPEANVICGNISEVVLGRKSFVAKISEFCKEWKSEPYFGIFMWHTPVLIINDLTVIKNILIDNSKLFKSPKINLHSKLSDSGQNSKIFEEQLTQNEIIIFDLLMKCATNETFCSDFKQFIEQKGTLSCSAFGEDSSGLFMNFWGFGGGQSENKSSGDNQMIQELMKRGWRLKERNEGICARLRGEKCSSPGAILADVICRKIKGETGNTGRMDFMGILRDSMRNDNDFGELE